MINLCNSPFNQEEKQVFFKWSIAHNLFTKQLVLSVN